MSILLLLIPPHRAANIHVLFAALLLKDDLWTWWTPPDAFGTHLHQCGRDFHCLGDVWDGADSLCHCFWGKQRWKKVITCQHSLYIDIFGRHIISKSQGLRYNHYCFSSIQGVLLFLNTFWNNLQNKWFELETFFLDSRYRVGQSKAIRLI